MFKIWSNEIAGSVSAFKSRKAEPWLHGKFFIHLHIFLLHVKILILPLLNYVILKLKKKNDFETVQFEKFSN